MAKRLTDTDKWDDDWFLELPPRFKCVWEYLRDTCSGVGIKKISFSNISNMIKEPITREEFERYIGDRAQWLNHETVWIHGFIVAQYKTLSPLNKVHINIAKKALRECENVELSPKAQAVANSLQEFLKNTTEALASPARQPSEARTGYIGYRKKDKGKRINTDSEITQEIENKIKAIYSAFYPLKKGKSKGIEKLLKEIKTDEELGKLEIAVRRYAEDCTKSKREPEFIMHFSTFANEWEDWLDPEVGTCATKSDQQYLKRGVSF